MQQESRTKIQKNRAQLFLPKARAAAIYGMRTREARLGLGCEECGEAGTGEWERVSRNRSAQVELGYGPLHLQRSLSGHSHMPPWRVSGPS